MPRKGYKQSDEHRAKRVAKLEGRVISEETVAKMREAQQRRQRRERFERGEYNYEGLAGQILKWADANGVSHTDAMTLFLAGWLSDPRVDDGEEIRFLPTDPGATPVPRK